MSVSKLLNEFGKPLHVNGKARPELIEALTAVRPNRQVKASYDAARDTDDMRRYWANADCLDADSADSKTVRHKLIKRSRYEQGSNGYYAGILKTYVNMLVGVGPKLRMLTKNRGFNQAVEFAFEAWAGRIQLRRKLWCMAHAKMQDGESFAILQTNPAILNGVSLDISLIEAEQCQTPYPPVGREGYIDGIKFDSFNNVQWYDVLPYHPGAETQFIRDEPIRVSPRSMLHWFKLFRPGAHRDTPAMKSTLNLGGAFRRLREANLSTAEKVAAWTLFLKTMFEPEEMHSVKPMTQLEILHGMMTALPNSVEPFQLKAEHPGANYETFHRSLLSEQARPVSMPYNAAACDSSTYSFASGKLDTLCFRAELDVDRADCNELVLDPLFGVWFREWRLSEDLEDNGPLHQWDWPAHPVIDEQADASANETKLRSGTTTLRESYSRQGKDYEDELVVMAEDWFGESSEESVSKARKINAIRNLPAHVIPHVTALFDLAEPISGGDQTDGQE